MTESNETLEQVMKWIDYRDAGESAPILIENLDIEDYHDMGNVKKHGWEKAVISKSQLGDMDCPAKFKHKHIDQMPAPDRDYFNVGNAVHTLALEPDLFHDRFYILPASVKDDKGEEKKVIRNESHSIYKKLLAEAGERKIITATDFIDIEGMAKSLASNKKAMALLDAPGLIEPSIFWTDKITGQKLRCRPDFLREDGLIVDLKTTRDVSPDKFSRDAWNMHYDVSVAMTCEGVKALKGKQPDNYVFLNVEKDAPYIIEAYDSFRPFDPNDMTKFTYFDAGSFRLKEALHKLQQCRKSDYWPGYSDLITPMSVPGYEMKKLEEKNQ